MTDISGKSLRSLLKQAAKNHSVDPWDPAGLVSSDVNDIHQAVVGGYVATIHTYGDAELLRTEISIRRADTQKTDIKKKARHDPEEDFVFGQGLFDLVYDRPADVVYKDDERSGDQKRAVEKIMAHGIIESLAVATINVSGKRSTFIFNEESDNPNGDYLADWLEELVAEARADIIEGKLPNFQKFNDINPAFKIAPVPSLDA